MNKVIWMIWWQGRPKAPELVQRCISSWEEKNPGWTLKCLDAVTIQYYVDLSDFVDLSKQRLTAASLSDVARIALLHEYGGVWADATTLCNMPLDDWLLDVTQEGFFAFTLHPFPSRDRPLSSWFLAAEAGNPLLGKWMVRVADYWRTRQETDDYFWFHHQFFELLEEDALAAQHWFRVPRLSANGPHSVQSVLRMQASREDAESQIDWSAPVFKLTYRVGPSLLETDTILRHVLDTCAPKTVPAVAPDRSQSFQSGKCASLRVSTQNRGDHIQILASRMLMERIGMRQEFEVDRDNEIASAPSIPNAPESVPILINGWHKTNHEEWPPNTSLDPVFLGFHIRQHQCPPLLSDDAIAYYKRFAPIGCRDIHTFQILQSKGVNCFVSNCLSLLFTRRLQRPHQQKEIFVVSRDERILDSIPAHIGDVKFINHYTDTHDFKDNLTSTVELLEEYRTQAKLIVTTLLHCALPAIAMGIPVVMIYPHNTERGHQSDLERLSSLARLLRIYSFDALHEVDWRGHSPDVSRHKLEIVEQFLSLSSRWQSTPFPLGPIAPSSRLPVPVNQAWKVAHGEGKLKESAPISDTKKWGNKDSYKSNWSRRAEMAARWIPSGITLLEIGAGTGALEQLLAPRLRYTGSDLSPLRRDWLKIDLEVDELPSMRFDYTVALGVFEYLSAPRAAARKICLSASNVITSYCWRNPTLSKPDLVRARRKRGWINNLTREEFVALFLVNGFHIIDTQEFSAAAGAEQTVFHFRQCVE